MALAAVVDALDAARLPMDFRSKIHLFRQNVCRLQSPPLQLDGRM